MFPTEKTPAALEIRRSDERPSPPSDQLDWIKKFPAQVALLDHKGRIRAVNTSWVRFFEFAGLPTGCFRVGQIFIEECRRASGVDPKIQYVLSGVQGVLSEVNAEFSSEFLCPIPGHLIWVRMLIKAFKDETHLGALLMLLDITAQKVAESRIEVAVQESAQFKRALDSHAIVAVTDSTGKITLVNDLFCQISGYSKEELVGQDHRIINSGFHSKDFFKEMWATIGRGSVWRRDVCNRAKDGSIYWVDTSIVPYLNADGKPTGYLTIRADITKRRMGEERISEQAALIDAAPNAITVIDLDRKILFWSRGVERIYGWSRDEAIGRQCDDLLQADVTIYKAAAEKVRKDVFWHGEMRMINKQGVKLILERSWSAVRDPEGKIKTLLTIDTDLTERKKLEQEFLRAQRMESIGTLAGGIAHDLNNVLAPILMSIELLRLDLDRDERNQILETIEKVRVEVRKWSRKCCHLHEVSTGKNWWYR